MRINWFFVGFISLLVLNLCVIYIKTESLGFDHVRFGLMVSLITGFLFVPLVPWLQKRFHSRF